MSIPLKNKIIISPIGNIDHGLIFPMIREIQRIFGLPIEKVTLLDSLEFAYDPKRNQYLSTLILEKLANHAPDATLKVIAVTRVDLFIPILTYVYGEAQLGGKACVISIHRLKENLSSMSRHDTFQSRVNKEAVHELGHTFKLKHCKDPTCIMHYCRSISDVDRKSDQLCRYCSILLKDQIKRLAGHASSAF